MLFNSLNFLIFFPLVTALYFVLPHAYRWLMLLIASCYFYMVFQPVYILILAFTIVVDYIAGLAIERCEGVWRRNVLIVSIVANLGVLAFFKYYGFLTQTWLDLIGITGLPLPTPPVLNFILPIGLSFHTFQSLSYTIEVYRKQFRAERHLGIFALYVMFYPQLVAGPIERPQNVLHQFRRRHYFEYDRVRLGLQLMLWGMFKKVFIADRLAGFTTIAFGDVHSYSGISFWVATVFFAFQIYCDFSGYSDIALGSAQVMGFQLMRNFETPYFSASVAEFWQRWHISLSTWFRDYLYISLGGNRTGRLRWYGNLFLTFLISGLWHGANWTYVIWGALNGLYLIAELQWIGAVRRMDASARGMTKWLVVLVRTLTTFAMICFAWIFFRASTVEDAMYIVTHLFTGSRELPRNLQSFPFIKANILFGQDKSEFILAIFGICVLLATHVLQQSGSGRDLLNRQPKVVRWSFYYVVTVLILFFGAFNESQQFIYFQF